MSEVRELGRNLSPTEMRKGEMEQNWFMKPCKLFSESHGG
jgi:hypothetical protein